MPHMESQSANEQATPREFRNPVSTGIFRHWRQLGEAALLLIFYVDRTTREFTAPDGQRLGAVYGGKPCRDADVAAIFGCSKWTVRNWRTRLAAFGYIRQRRTPIGYVITVVKSKKWTSTKRGNELKGDTTQSCVPAQLRIEQAFNSELNTLSTPIKTGQGQDKEKQQPGFDFEGQRLRIRSHEDAAFRRAFPNLDLRAQYARMDSYLVAHPERHIRKFGAFAQSWLSREGKYFGTMPVKPERVLSFEPPEVSEEGKAIYARYAKG